MSKTVQSAEKLMGTVLWDAEGVTMIEKLCRMFFICMIMQDHTPLKKIVKIGWEVLFHLLYSLDLAPSDFHLFGPLKGVHRGIYFEVEEAVKTLLR